jgi:hypothetical protein
MSRLFRWFCAGRTIAVGLEPIGPEIAGRKQ